MFYYQCQYVITWKFMCKTIVCFFFWGVYLVVLVACTLDQDLIYCYTCTDKKNSYDVKVSGVEITPYPIERGTETTFTITASTGRIVF